MKTLEERIQETLQREAPVHVRSMPKGTGARVRARQTLASAVTVAAVVAVAMAAMSVLSAAPRASQPGSQQTAPPPAGFLPYPQGSQGGADDATAATDNDATPREVTSAHGTNSTEPYTEQVDGQEAYLLTQKHAVAVGHVNGVEWSLAAYDTRRQRGCVPTVPRGSCGDMMVGDQGEYGASFCLHTVETDPDAQFALAGFGNGLDPNTDPIVGYAGLLGSHVFVRRAAIHRWSHDGAAAVQRAGGDRRSVLRDLRAGWSGWPHRGARVGRLRPRFREPLYRSGNDGSPQHRLWTRAGGGELGGHHGVARTARLNVLAVVYPVAGLRRSLARRNSLATVATSLLSNATCPTRAVTLPVVSLALTALSTSRTSSFSFPVRITGVRFSAFCRCLSSTRGTNPFAPMLGSVENSKPICTSLLLSAATVSGPPRREARSR